MFEFLSKTLYKPALNSFEEAWPYWVWENTCILRKRLNIFDLFEGPWLVGLDTAGHEYDSLLRLQHESLVASNTDTALCN